ncbi:MAG: hypothetical protein Q9214_003021, partial [Letrouitia sp. 1 TL-2023]
MHILQLFLSLGAVLGVDAAAVIGGTSPSSSLPAAQYTQLPHLYTRAEGDINCRGSMGCQQLWKACPEASGLIEDKKVYKTG